MQVTETIRVRAQGAQIRHGIYRDFPQLYQGRWGLRTQTGFNVQSVRRDGQPEPYHKQDQRNGTRVYFGSSSVELSPGDYTYELVYETDHQIGFFKTHDELYWNVTGNGWIFPINRVAASVTLPDGAEPNHLEAYTGPQGARGKDYTAEVVGGRAHFQTTRLLSPAEGLTIVVTWPKGFMAPPAAGEDLMRIIKANKGLAVAVFGLFLGLVYYVVAWAKVGRDPKPGTIIPLYDAPGGFSPAAVRYLAQMGFDNRTLTAAILNLAVKGKLTIHEDQAKAYTLIRTNAPTDGLAPEELALLNRLFAQGTRLAMLQANCVTLQAATSGLRARLAKAEEKVFFVRNLRYWLPGLLLVFVTATTLFTGTANDRVPAPVLWIIGVVAADLLLVVLFYHLLKAPTAQGRKILDQIEGFKLYLSVAEKDRLNLENPPERTPELFERFLPYALALGVEQKWSDQFAAVLATAGQGGAAYSPTWYSGRSWTGNDLNSLTHSMSSSLSHAIASASTAPGSSSGSDGGGSSGGGGGGGGGGGW